MTGNDEYILEILKDVGMVKAEQIEEAKALAVSENNSLVDVLIENGVITKMDV